MVLPLLGASACGDGDPLTAPAPDPEPPVEALTGGYFIGHLCDELASFCSQAIITEDGQVRMYLEPLPDRIVPLQFVGAVDPDAPEASWFPGRLIGLGLHCAGPDPTHECAGRPGEIRLSFPTTETLLVRIRWFLEGPDVDVVESFSMYRPTSTYETTPATFEVVAGTYHDVTSDFAQHEAEGAGVLVTVDGSGNLSFRSAANGCTGEGVLSPYLDGTRNVYSVEITIKDCNATYAYLNGSLEGLATRSINRIDEDFGGDFIDSLTLWLSSPPGAGSDVALTMGGDRQD